MKTKKVAFMGLFLALALVAGYVERLIPINLGVPGVKIGLANIVTMVLLYCVGWKEAVWISAARILLSGLLFGSGFAMVYSAAGAVFSILVMILLKKTKLFHSVGVSVMGGVFHNVGQILVAMVVLETKSLIYYLPILILSGLTAGIFVGLLSGWLTTRIHPVLKQEFGNITK
ncbi:MAG: Gx transporter family protein [Eubacteriales bacterium]|nr:Gx transporter family protein [Eubacteriales bacterium]